MSRTKSSRVSSVARDPRPLLHALYRKFNPCCRPASSFKVESCNLPRENRVKSIHSVEKSSKPPLEQWKNFPPTLVCRSLNLFDQNNLFRLPSLVRCDVISQREREREGQSSNASTIRLTSDGNFIGLPWINIITS